MGIADDFIEEIERETREQELAAIYADPTSLDDAIEEINHLRSCLTYLTVDKANFEAMGARVAELQKEASIITNAAHSRFMNIEVGYKRQVERIASLEAENAHLRQELARLTESANKDRAALNLIEDALRGRGRE